MELRQLKYFAMVAKTLNYSEASRKLFITQGTLSQQIMQLEAELGEQLFVRGAHGVALSEAGEELLPYAKKTLEASDECKSKMHDLKDHLSGTINIGVTHSFSGILTGTIKDFLNKYPGVKLNIFYKTATELFEMIYDKDVDFVLAFKPSSEYAMIDSEVLFNTSLSAIMRRGHPLSERSSVTMDELSKYGLALPGSGLQARRAFERFVNLDTRNYDVRAELSDPTILMDILQSTNLVSVLSSLAVAYRPSLVAIPLEGVKKEMTGCIHTLRDGYRKNSVEVFLDMLRDTALIEKISMGG